MRKLIKSQSYNSISDTPVPQWAKKGRPSNLDGRDKLALSEKCPNINLPNTKQLKSKSVTHIMVAHLSLSLTLAIIKNHPFSWCLKITGKVSFNIASEASYVYIFSGQKLIKNTKNGPFWRVFENLKFSVIQCYQTGHFLNFFLK